MIFFNIMDCYIKKLQKKFETLSFYIIEFTDVLLRKYEKILMLNFNIGCLGNIGYVRPMLLQDVFIYYLGNTLAYLCMTKHQKYRATDAFYYTPKL